jgi:hypothetical protein
MAPEANLLDHVVVELQRRVLEAGRRLHVPEVEEQPSRIDDLFLVVGNFSIELYGDAHAVGQHRPPDVLERCQFPDTGA